MGYDMDMVVLKKKTLKQIEELIPKHSFRFLYSEFLFPNLYPEDYEIPEDEIGRFITWSNWNVFRDFFNIPLENDAVIIIEENTYKKMCDWLKEKLKSKTLYDLACDEKYDEYETAQLIRIYKQMTKEQIDFETEFIVYQHNW